MWSALGALSVLGAALWFWRDCLETRELALRVCRRTCTSYQVQLLDDTVALASMWPVLERGHLVLRRVYQFEYSLSSADRRTGALALSNRRVDSIFLEAGAEHDGTISPP